MTLIQCFSYQESSSPKPPSLPPKFAEARGHCHLSPTAYNFLFFTSFTVTLVHFSFFCTNCVNMSYYQLFLLFSRQVALSLAFQHSYFLFTLLESLSLEACFNSSWANISGVVIRLGRSPWTLHFTFYITKHFRRCETINLTKYTNIQIYNIQIYRHSNIQQRGKARGTAAEFRSLTMGNINGR